MNNEEERLDRILGEPRYNETSLDDLNATLFTIACSLEEIHDKIKVAVVCLVIIAGLLAGYFWRTGFFTS